MNLLLMLSGVFFAQDLEFDTDKIMEYVMDIVHRLMEAIGDVFQGIWDALWNTIDAYIGRENAFWITIVLIMLLSVYIIVWRFVLD